MTAPDLSTTITILAGLAAFVSVLAVGLPLLRRDYTVTRLKAVAERRRELSSRQRAGFEPVSARFQSRRHIGAMRAVLDRLKMESFLDDKALRQRLARAGWRRPSAAVVFLFARVALPLVTLAVAGLYMTMPAFNALSFMAKAAIVLTLALMASHLPHLLLANAVTKRQKVLTRAFPDALDLMVICVEAGLSIEGAFQRVTEEMLTTASVLAEEIALTSAEIAFLTDRRAAFDNFAERSGLPAIKSLCTTLVQAERYGTPISVALKVLSQENRDSRMAAAEKKAASLPAKLTVPMIVFFLPVLFLVIMGPAVIQVMAMMGH